MSASFGRVAGSSGGSVPASRRLVDWPGNRKIPSLTPRRLARESRWTGRGSPGSRRAAAVLDGTMARSFPRAGFGEPRGALAAGSMEIAHERADVRAPRRAPLREARADSFPAILAQRGGAVRSPQCLRRSRDARGFAATRAAVLDGHTRAIDSVRVGFAEPRDVVQASVRRRGRFGNRARGRRRPCAARTAPRTSSSTSSAVTPRQRTGSATARPIPSALDSPGGAARQRLG